MRWLTRAFGGNARAPRNVGSALRAALLAVLDRNYDRAEELLAQAVRLDADDVDAYLSLARLYRIRGEIGRAIRVHQNMLLRSDLSPERRITVLCDLGSDFAHGGFLRRAIASYEEVLVLDKRNPRALRELVRLLVQARDFPRALELTRQFAKKGDPEGGLSESDLLVRMAEAARAQGDPSTARKHVRRALWLEKNHIDALVLHGELHLERGKAKAALACWERVPKLDRGKGALVYHWLEATYASRGQKVEYERFLRRLIDEVPNDRDARYALAKTLSARGLVDAAIAELRTLMERDEDDLAARAALGELLLRDDRPQFALREYQALIDSLERLGLTNPPPKPELP
jgi:lipopolysaccharide biosynthesis regulator YciM